MDVVSKPAVLRETCLGLRCSGEVVALVPTMGRLHEGHLSLIRFARDNADKVVVSLFVNPTQFGPNEDFASYPRDLERDRRLAAEAGADILFTPEPEDMFPEDAGTWVQVPGPSARLCGVSRPTHFRGVATVVAKLLLLALPGLAVFGQKDWQQLVVIRRMAADLGFPTEIVGRPIVREPDGLAMSSRNLNLAPQERKQAVHLHKGLSLAADLAARGERSAGPLLETLAAYYREHAPLGEIDYLELVHPHTLLPASVIEKEALLAVAVKFSGARLIDNLLVAV